MSATRTETDSFGPLEVPADKYWGAQTQRSMILHANIQDGEIFISNDQGQITFVPEVWREAKD